MADEVYGSDGKFWWWLEKEHQQAYVLSVSVKHSVCIGYQLVMAAQAFLSVLRQQVEPLERAEKKNAIASNGSMQDFRAGRGLSWS